MAKAYNVGTKMAKGDILVYVHEDVRLIDSRFDELVTKATEDPKTGFVGPIGTTGVSTGAWWETPRNFYKGFIMGDGIMDDNGYYDGPAKGLDALLMATRHRFTFPEELPGVHFLDQWACRLAEEKGLTNRIFPAVVQHLSRGNADTESFQYNLKLYQKRWFPYICPDASINYAGD